MKFLVAAVTLVFAAAGLFLVGVAHVETGGNLLRNPGFESGTDHWKSSGGTLTYADKPVCSGKRAGLFVVHQPEACIYQTIAISPGATYVFCGNATKAEDSIYDADVSLRISWWTGDDGDGEKVDECGPGGSIPLGSWWLHLAGLCHAPASAHSASAEAMVKLADVGGPVTVYFDGMIFAELKPSPTAAPTPTPVYTPTPPPTCPPNHLLTDPGFEDGDIGWRLYAGTFTQVTSPVHGGRAAACLSSTSRTAARVYQVVSVAPRESYTLCGWAMRDAPDANAKVYFRVSWYESEDGYGGEVQSLASTSSELTSNSTDYQRLTVTATAPEGARSARLEGVLDPHSDAVAATAYFDDLSFVGPAPLPTPSPTPTPEPTPSPTPTPGPTAGPTAGPIPTPSPTPTPSALPTSTRTPAPQPEPTPTPEATALPTPAVEGDVVINEVQYDAVQAGTDAAYEWLELLNRTGRAIDMNGWIIADNSGVDRIPGLLLPPGGFAVIAASPGFYDSFPGFHGAIAFIADGRIGNGLSNDGDRLSLLDRTGKVIDALSYGSDTTVMSPPARRVTEGHSLERHPAGFDTGQASDFVDNGSPSPGSGLASPTPTPTQPPATAQTPASTPEAPPVATGSPKPAGLGTPAPAMGGGGTPVGTEGPQLTATPGAVATAVPSPSQGASPPGSASRVWLYALAGCAGALAAMAIVMVLPRLRKKP